MKEFAIYTGLRLGLFVAAFATVAGIWMLATGGDLPLLPPLVIAFLISGVVSWFALERQRVAFATRVDKRARKAGEAFEERRAKEDQD